MVRDSIRPDVTMFLHYQTIEEDGDRFEAMRCLNQELTFEAAKKEFTLWERRGCGQIPGLFKGSERSRIRMYLHKKIDVALKVCHQCGSVTTTIRVLGYPTRRALYTWIANEGAAKPER